MEISHPGSDDIDSAELAVSAVAWVGGISLDSIRKLFLLVQEYPSSTFYDLASHMYKVQSSVPSPNIDSHVESREILKKNFRRHSGPSAKHG